MNEQLHDALLKEEYILKRMVYVNSAGHGYSEILLDKHLAMFGENNMGKTASLAGTKLLLYPESNMRKCDKKFQFEGSEGLFSMEESYDFYFPNSKSFIVLEVENPEGVFCMVLHKKSNYEYGRLFIPLDYDDLRPLFWSEESESFSGDLGVASLKSFTQKNNGVQVSDESELRALMFGSARSDNNRKRFCVLPLKEATTESVEAFRSIYQLAFDTANKKTKTLPTAVATLLEMGRGRNQEKLNSNLEELNEQYSKLLSKKDYFDALENAGPYYTRASDAFKKFNEVHLIYSQLYVSIKSDIQKKKENYAAQHASLEEAQDRYSHELEKLKKQLEQANKQKQELTGEKKGKQQSLTRDRERSTSIKQKISKYGSEVSREYIIGTLKEYAEKLEEELALYERNNGLQELLQRQIGKKKQAIKNKESAELFIKNASSSFLSQLDDKSSASILLSLNKAFGGLSTKVNPEILMTIKAFTELFNETEHSQLEFLGEPFEDVSYEEYNELDEIQKAKTKVEVLNDEIRVLNDDISRYNEALQSRDFKKLVADTQKELAATNQDIENINGLPIIINRISETESELISMENTEKALSITIEDLLNKHAKALRSYNDVKDSMKELERDNSLIRLGDTQLESASFLCDISSSVTKEPISISEKCLENLTDLANQAKVLKETTKKELSTVLRYTDVPEVDPHKQLVSTGDIEQLMERLRDIYETLDYELIQYRNEIQSHNRFVSGQLNELRSARDFLQNFVREINTELNNQKISNLSEITLNLEIHPAFESLLNTLDKHDIEDASLLDDSFYSTLANFVNKFFDKRKKRLKMKDIIESITYEYTLQETGKRIKKSQSGGTSSTVTAFILSVLLNRITPSYVTLKMPIIVDEISTLDLKNTKATIKQISEHGFSIFCATPTYSGYISSKVGRWITIGRSVVQAPVVQGCYINLLPKDIETFGENQNAS